MKGLIKYVFLLLACPVFGQAVVFTSGVNYTSGAPTHNPGKANSRVAIDTVTWLRYEHVVGTTWTATGYAWQEHSGCTAPSATPTKHESIYKTNTCSPPKMYKWTGAAWVQLNEGEVYTAGAGISINGSNVISYTAPNVVQTLSIAGQDLTLTNGGGTVEIPAGDALGTGFTSGGGKGTIPSGTIATVATYGNFRMNYGSTNTPFLLLDDDEGIVALYSSDGNGVFEMDSENATIRSNNAALVATGGVASVIASVSGKVELSGDGVVLPNLTTAQRNALSGVSTGTTIYNTDATATDGSTGVMQVWNGSVWKNAW